MRLGASTTTWSPRLGSRGGAGRRLCLASVPLLTLSKLDSGLLLYLFSLVPLSHLPPIVVRKRALVASDRAGGLRVGEAERETRRLTRDKQPACWSETCLPAVSKLVDWRLTKLVEMAASDSHL
jgi:hypothetical protein